MSNDAAAADLAAAAYWKNVARADRAEIGVATTKVTELVTAAQQEAKEPSATPRRARSLGAG